MSAHRLSVVLGVVATTLFVSRLLVAGGESRSPGHGLTDPKATAETRSLFLALRELAGSKLLFGHQDTTAYGVGWSAEDGRSDVKSITGSYPAVYGWDIGHLGDSRNLDRVEFSRIKNLIRECPQLGQTQISPIIL